MTIQNVLLDLDNTLISAEPCEDFPIKDTNVRNKILRFTFHDMDGYYIVFERPNLQEFLDDLFSNYNVSVWTAASKDYAVYVIDQIVLPESKRDKRKLDYIMFSYHCDMSRKKYHTPKHLNMLYDVFRLPGYDRSNTIIIDDLIDVYKCQPSNCINIKAFNFFESQSDKDTTLKHIPTQIKEKFLSLKN